MAVEAKKTIDIQQVHTQSTCSRSVFVCVSRLGVWLEAHQLYTPQELGFRVLLLDRCRDLDLGLRERVDCQLDLRNIGKIREDCPHIFLPEPLPKLDDLCDHISVLDYWVRDKYPGKFRLR